VQTANRTAVYSLPLVDGAPTRAADEATATCFMLWAIARSCGVAATELERSLPQGWHDAVRCGEADASPAETELLLYARWRAVLRPGSAVDYFPEGQSPATAVVFPGAFNPPHTGHLGMAAVAEVRLQRPLTWELSITNVDKPPLDFISIRDRAEAIRKADSERPVALTRAESFRQKASLFPGATFVVGADTLLRIAEPRYYADSSRLRDKAIARISQQGCRFLVFGRQVEGQFMSLGDLNIPAELRTLCDEVPPSAFREDISSTELRKGN
jgi:nicotinic acid mononucleotide adenylyltransferase